MGGGLHGSLSLLTPRGAVSIPQCLGQAPRGMPGGRATVIWAVVVTEEARSLFMNLTEQVESLKGLYGVSSPRNLEVDREQATYGDEPRKHPTRAASVLRTLSW